MRRRQLQSTLVVVLVAICALGIPLAYFVVHSAAVDARSGLLREADAVAALVEDRLEAGRTVTAADLTRLIPANRHVVVRLSGGVVVQAGEDVGAGPYSVTQQLGTDGSVRIERAADEVRDRQLRSLGLVVGLALLAAAIALWLAIRFARRLSIPLQLLAEHADRLGRGDVRLSEQRYGIPELDAVAVVLDSSTLRVADLLERERQLVGDISHQLRSGLTALSMRLEELISSTDESVRTEAEVALSQTDRLAGVIDELLAQAHQERAGAAMTLDVTEQLEEMQREFAPTLTAIGRQVELRGDAALDAVATPGRLHQVLGVLVENAIRHGTGTVVLSARRTGSYVLIEVCDDGPGIPDELVSRIFDRGVSGAAGTGLGLGLARSLADADGGRLELRSARPAIFGLFLPCAPSIPSGAAQS